MLTASSADRSYYPQLWMLKVYTYYAIVNVSTNHTISRWIIQFNFQKDLDIFVLGTF